MASPAAPSAPLLCGRACLAILKCRKRPYATGGKNHTLNILEIENRAPFVFQRSSK